MGDENFWRWLAGIIAGAYLLVLKWTHTRASTAHDKIDAERKDMDAKINLVYAKIDESIARTEKCRLEIKKDLDVRMTEPHIKEYVALKIEPLANKVDEIHVDVKALLARKVR